MDQEIRTPRLVVRRFRHSDGPGLYGYLSRPEAVRFEPYPVQTLAECERLAVQRAASADFWAVCLPGDRLIGNLYFVLSEPQWRTWELGYVFSPDHWGNGYATEAASALVSAAFADGAHRVVARCDPLNTASWRLLERLGFRREGHLRQNASFSTGPNGEPVWKDTFLYAVLAEEWSVTPSA